MATFDQLAADQRAIIEIVLKQGRSYDQIGDMLDLPPTRVRELARDALAELAPYTAEFVDEQWRGQVADYVLGQQTGPEAQATKGHLRRSEPARIWAYSLVDALDDFYGESDRPDIPVGETGAKARSRAAVTNGEGPAETPLAAPRLTRGEGGSLSPAAQSALMRRRILAGVGIVALVALLIFGGIKLFGGGSDNKSNKTPTTASSTGTGTTATGAQGQGQVIAQAILTPVGKSFKGSGAAFIYQSGNQAFAILRAKVPPSSGGNKYVLWLYDGGKNYYPLAADVTDKQGNFQGAAQLPGNWTNYKFLDMTYQTPGKKTKHGTTVMRGPLTAPSQQATGGGTGTGTTTTP